MQEVFPAEVGPSRITAKSDTATTEANCLRSFLKEGVSTKLFSSKFWGGKSPYGMMLYSMHAYFSDSWANFRPGSLVILKSLMIRFFTKSWRAGSK